MTMSAVAPPPQVHLNESNMDTSSFHVPDEVIELILSKCPAKSVVRFKSVSKSWRSILSDPRFATTHRIQHSGLPDNESKFLIWSGNDLPPPKVSADYTVYLVGFEGGKFQRGSQVGLSYESQSFIRPLCYCDGLFLLCNHLKHDYTLWNPSIAKPTIIRPPIPKNADPSICLHHLYHDSVTDAYKIVFVYENSYSLYSCNNGSSCEEIKDFPRNIDLKTLKASLDGCFYFVQGSGEIVCFDVRDENLHKFWLPHGVAYTYMNDLKVVSGRLCLLALISGTRRMQLWVMEKNGSWCFSWRNLFTLEMNTTEDFLPVPIWLSNEDNVVLRAGPEEHMIYNPRRNSLQPVHFNWNYSTHRSELYPYSENLYMPSSNVCSGLDYFD